MTRLALLLALGALLGAAACAESDVDRVARDARERAGSFRAEAERFRRDARDLRGQGRELRRRLRQRVRETLDRIEQAIPEATAATRPPRRGDASLEAFMTEVLRSVDLYWTRTLAASGLPEPRVGYNWPPSGVQVRTGCGSVVNRDAALYCPADDTIYVAQEFAGGVLRGVRDDFPGQQAGQGRAIGDFGVAYIIAHEYGHNVQQELGYFDAGRQASVKPFELQADCMAGSWGNSVYQAGKLKPGDIEEALGTVTAVGDFEYLSPQHHGTPAERRRAFLLGYESGDPSRCQAYVPTG